MVLRTTEVKDRIAILEGRLKEWGLDLEKFRMTAAKANGEAKVRLEHDAETLQTKLNDVRRQLDVLKKSGVAASGELKKGVEGAWAELEKAFVKAKARFK